jgi:hypothetical protein
MKISFRIYALAACVGVFYLGSRPPGQAIEQQQLHRPTDGDLLQIYEYRNTYTLDSPPLEMKPIILRVPEKFRYGSSRGATRAWGLNILTFYPSFTSPSEPENAKFGEHCTGDCNGRMLISIENEATEIHNPRFTNGIGYPNMGDAVAHIWLKRPLIPIGSNVSNIDGIYGFTKGYQVTIHNGNNEQRNLYLFHMDDNHTYYDATAICSVNKYAKTCTLHFSSSCNPAIYIQDVAFDMKYVLEWRDIKKKTDAFVNEMVRFPVCN